MDIYKFAAKNKLRFPSVRGELIVENLFDLPLKSNSGFDLNTVAKNIDKELKITQQGSYVDDESVNDVRLSVSLDIVKDVIKTKKDEITAVKDQVRRMTERRKILDAIADKEDSARANLSLDELKAQLAELDK